MTLLPSHPIRRASGPVEPTHPFLPVRPEDLEGSAVDYFEKVVARGPERRAVCTRTADLTYDTLNQWANRIARYLLARRSTSDEPVALLFGHGDAAIPALLGALKSGKPYVALDASYPLERLKFIVEKLGAGLLLHDAANVALAEELARHVRLPLGCVEEADRRYGTDNLGLRLAPEHPTFVIFTSGSTGRPKGVTFTHRMRLMSHMEFVNRLHVSAEDRLTALHSIGFGASVSEIYGALMTGASLYPLNVQEEGFLGLTQWMQEHELTLLQWTPTAFRRFASELSGPELFPHLRMIVLGGEPVTPREVELYRSRFVDGCLLVNRYGATETANTCYYVIDRSTPLPGEVMPVGYPVERCEMLILDADGEPLPPGNLGEIAVKSCCISPGYWRDPELTVSRFLSLPGEEARIYRTGDLGRQAPDGCLEHLGRKDDQIKVRGYRIELLEIDAALLKLPDVRNASAAAFPDAQGETRITGYVVPAVGSTLSVPEVQEALRALLPGYMIPSNFVVLDELPLTLSGKVQRSALPRPDAGRASSTIRLSSAEATPGPPIILRTSGMVTPSTPFTPLQDADLERSIPEFMEEVVARYPNRRAVRTRSGELTYDALNRWANRIARYLLARRPSSDEPVALLFDHDLAAIPALLGALKSGKTYVALDPTFPLDRLRFVIEKMGATFLLHDAPHTALAEALAASAGIAIGCVDAVDATYSTDNLCLSLSPDRPAYVMFTSGSTGKPKGVIVPHRTRLLNQKEFTAQLHVNPDDRFTSLHSIGFSASSADIYGALMSGASVYPLDIRKEGFAGLSAWMRENDLTVFQWVAGGFRRFTAELSSDEQFPHLRLIVLGSEPVSAYDADLYRRHFSEGCLLVNRYGTTETGNSHYYLIDRSTPVPTATLPVGYPTAARKVELLDEGGKPVPQGEPGEIVVTSRHVTPGYWGEPELTAERFRTAPNGVERTYRTGDLGRLAPDGCLEHLGRKDGQVKVRGHRIELVEIEAVLLSVPGVRDAAAIAPPDAAGELRIAAYVTLIPGSPVTAERLRQAVRARLPEYMLPSAFVFLETLPLTPTGKVLRSALPPPRWDEVEERAPYAAPETELQRETAALFAAVLGLERIGLDDSFFTLGGDSLRAAQVASRLHRLLGRFVGPPLIFAAPTVRLLAEALSTPALGGTAQNLPEILRLPDGADAPLSFAQQRLWFVDRLEPDSTAFNEPLLLEMTGELNIGVLQSALDTVVQRHAVLRSHYPLMDGQPVQRVDAVTAVTLALDDLSSLPSDEQEAARALLVRDTVTTRFDLATGPVYRARLVRLSADRHLLVLAIHHIATDGVSFQLLLTELVELYRAGLEDRAARLPDLPIQFRDFAASQREQGNYDEDLTYWTRRLADAPTAELPLDFPRPTTPRHDGAREVRALSPELTQSVTRLAAAEGATPFMVLLGALALLLGRWTGVESLVIGAPIIDRPYPQTEALIGVFLNNLALHLELRGNPTFRELLAQTRKTTADAYAHAAVPFERVVDALKLERDTSRHPVFEVMLNHLDTPPVDLTVPGLTLRRLRDDHPAAKLPFTLYTGVRDGRLTFNLVYQTALFNSERMCALLEQLELLLTQVTGAPDLPIDRPSLVTSAAREALSDLTLALDRPLLPSVIETFLAVAAAKPQATALVQGERDWSYAQLAAAVEGVAAGLADQPRDAVIAIIGERIFELIAGMLGVLRSGRVLLTLDPALPVARREVMMQESGCRLMLNADAAPSPSIGAVEGRQLAELRKAEGVLPAPDELRGPAYVFFTSGSTGTPKAVLGTHEGLAHFIRWQRETFSVSPTDRCAQLTGLSFDVLLRDLFLPLTSGAALCLPTTADLEDGAAVIGWLERERVSAMHSVPSLVRHWLGTHPGAGSQSLRALRYLFLAGEPLTAELVTRWRASFPQGGEIVNLYGPTETTLAKLCYRVPELLQPGVQPIGQPLPETQALIVASSGRACGMYEPGEIVLRTPFRTRGYLNAPDENARRFVRNPCRADDPDDLLYHTGDRGYYRPDGSLAILGRLDQQVKIRGVRVELGEIEAALLAHPAVREVAVDLRQDGTGEGRLTAYFVRTPGAEVSALRRFMAERLPAALVPSAFVELERLPLTPNGKLDRASLPEPELAVERRSGPVAPRNDVERRLAVIWETVLGVRSPGVHDDFFALGGHSLLVVQLLARIEREFGKSLPLASVMHASTLAEQALLVRGDVPIVGASVLVPLQPAGTRAPLFGVHGIGGGVLCYRALAALLGEDQPFYGLQAPALAGLPAEHLTVEQMAEQYVRAIREVRPTGPYHLLGLSFGGNIALEMARQLLEVGEQVALLGMLDSKGPGYPRFPGRLPRIVAHVKHFAAQSPAGRAHYVGVRVSALRDQLRRRLLGSWYRRVYRKGETLPRLLDDIGIGHIQAAKEFRRGEYPGRITLFRADLQPIGCLPEWDNGWSRVARGGVEVHPVPGEHASIVEEPHVAALAAAVEAALAKPAEPRSSKAGDGSGYRATV